MCSYSRYEISQCQAALSSGYFLRYLSSYFLKAGDFFKLGLHGEAESVCKSFRQERTQNNSPLDARNKQIWRKAIPGMALKRLGHGMQQFPKSTCTGFPKITSKIRSPFNTLFVRQKLLPTHVDNYTNLNLNLIRPKQIRVSCRLNSKYC